MWPVHKSARHPLLNDVLLSEVDPKISRSERMLQAGESELRVVPGMLLAAALLAIAAVAAEGNAGNGTIAEEALGPNAIAGDYTVEFLTATTFAVFDPVGNRLADGATGAVYDNGQIAFEIAVGGSAFEAGDSFIVTVTESDGPYGLFDPDAVDGRARNPVIAADNRVAPAGQTVPVATLERLCVLKGSGILWPDGITQAQKAAVLSSFASRFITVLQST